MTSTNSFLPEGASINRPPVFNGEGYAYWKTCMRIFIEAVDLDVQDAVENGPFVLTHILDGRKIEKLRDEWTDEDKKKVQYSLRAKNIITSALGHDEFFRVLNQKTA